MGGLPRNELSRVRAQLSESLGLQLAGVSFIKDNGTCRIYQAFTSGEPVIVKQYGDQNAAFARQEAEALDLYDRVCGDVPDAIPARTVVFNPDTNTLCMSYVHGRPLSEILERARQDESLQRRFAHAIEVVGAVLQKLHEATAEPGARPSPFLREYIRYVSNGLESLPVLGRTLFRGYREQAEELWRNLLHTRVTPSTCHGDLALSNIRMRGYRVGLIDFASTTPRSHLLGDVYGLAVYLLTKRPSGPFRRSILGALYRGIGSTAFPEPLHHFHWEMQRRRWLFLKLVRGNGLTHLDGLRALSDLGLSLRTAEAYPLPT